MLLDQGQEDASMKGEGEFMLQQPWPCAQRAWSRSWSLEMFNAPGLDSKRWEGAARASQT